MSETAGMLNLLSFVVNNPGLTVAETAAATGRDPDKLIAELNRLNMIGVPPYMPHDYLSVTPVRSPSCRVVVTFGEHFERPVTFTPQEAIALKCALELFERGAEPEASKIIGDAIATLGEALHGRAGEEIAGRRKGFVTPSRTLRMRELLAKLEEGCERGHVTEIDYYSAHRNSLGVRRVHPFEIVEIGAHFYLFAWCETAHDTRHFRLDRVRSARILEQPVTRKRPRRRESGGMAPVFEGKPRDTLTIRFDKSVADDIVDDWSGSPGATVQVERDGRALLKTPLYNQFWAVGYVMSFGDKARLQGPEWLRGLLVETIQRSLKAHRA